MRRALAVILFLVATLVSVYAWQSLSDAISLNGNAVVRYHHQPLTWHLHWVLLGVLLTGAFAAAARGRWRFAASVPLLICALVAYLTVVLTRAFA